MATTITATKISGPGISGNGIICQFTLALTDTDGSGLQTLDLTDWFSYVKTINIGGSLASNGYYVDVQKPAYDTAIDATNIKLGFYEAGADADVLDAVATTTMTSAITGLTITVTGKPALDTSWA